MSSINLQAPIIGYSPIPEVVIDRNGLRVRTNEDIWLIHTAGSSKDSINLRRIRNPLVRYAFAKYLVYRIKKHSPHTVISFAHTVLGQLSPIGFLDQNFQNVEEIEQGLVRAVTEVLTQLRSEGKLSQFYDLSRWYLWGAENLPECGFNPEFALFLSRLQIPGDVKGEAVRSRDPEEGPLHFELEEPLIRKALLADTSEEFDHLQQRLAVALSLAFGRNPLNFVRLREVDFFNLTMGFPNAEEVWQLNIPRIKKRSAPRELFRTETCDDRLAQLIKELITTNQRYSTFLEGAQMPRPLFLRKRYAQRLVGTDSQEYAFHISVEEFRKLIQDWTKRMRLVSPITGTRLHLTPRRLRYTFACNMARQGVSRAALAEMLDHTDTQNVGVYYDLFDELVGMLDKALAMKIGGVLGWFKGHVIDEDSEVDLVDVNEKHLVFVSEENPLEQVEIGVCGEAKLCHLDPPYSCYLCPKFHPYRHASHEKVLEILLSERKIRFEKYENSRLGVQLDDVIYAVAQAVAVCKGSEQ
jgi:integrase